MNKTTCKALLFALFLLPLADLAHGQSFVATFVAVKGEVKVLKKPSTPEEQKAPQAMYEGETYSWFPARIGRKVGPKEIIQTGPNGQAKIVYQNGDHFAVGPGTSFSLPTINEAKGKDPSKLNMFYGKIRAMVSKNGPRNNLEVKTISAVAGVRGTDFFISESGNNGCKITVMRGKVEVKPDTDVAASPEVAKPTMVDTGYTAQFTGEVDPATSKLKKVKVDLKEATKEHLLDIQTSSTVKSDPAVLAAATTDDKKQAEQLNGQSFTAILSDIQATDPRLYKRVSDKKITDLDTLNTEVVAGLYKGAPSEDPKRKPTKAEIDALGQDVYEKYFKPSVGPGKNETSKPKK